MKTQCPRIFCIGRNYSEHINELGNEKPEKPVVFMKHPDCLLSPGKIIPYPAHAARLEQEGEVVFRMGKFFIDGVTLGLDLTLRDLQKKLKDRGLPWEAAKSFEASAPLGQFVTPGSVGDINAIPFRCLVNGEIRQESTTAEMIFSLEEIVAHLKSIWTLKPGDLIFSGTPAGVGPLKPGDEVIIESPKIGKFSWTLGPADKNKL